MYSLDSLHPDRLLCDRYGHALSVALDLWHDPGSLRLLEGQEETAWQGFSDGIARLTGYLAQHHPDEYNALLEETRGRRAEALRAVLGRIEWTFTATGKTGGGRGNKSSRLTKVTIDPVSGDPKVDPVDSQNALQHEQALAWWYSFVNYEVRTPQPDDLKLDRMRELLRRLGDPQRRLRLLHVAGSKGKGSTAAMLAAVLRRAGYRTGLFTSPHLCRVEERLQVDGEPVTAPELTALLDEVRGALAAGPRLEPTFFEIATAAGFLHFVRRRVDAAVVEVGLGGRFDSTNVCRPAVALITSISFDHTQQLGNRLASIAMEKAGILKPGVPAVSGVTVPEAREVIERIARERGSPLRQLGADFHYRYEPGRVTADGLRRPRVEVRTWRRTWPVLEVGLLGEHQAANAAVALACVELLRERGWHVGDAAVAAGLAEVAWPARLEVVSRRPLVVLDCAHNVASAHALAETLRESFPAGRRLLVFAASSDKDLAGMLGVLAPHFAHAFVTRYGQNTRSAPPEDLADLLRGSGLPATVCGTATEAWQAARAAAGPDDLVCVTGSVYLAGELRPVLVGCRSDPGEPPGLPRR
jgi:dihydrofolate synthase/folylpolyglutamate synthase